MLVSGHRAKPYGINSVGLKRKNFPEDVVRMLKECYRIVFRNETPLKEALEQAESQLGEVKEVKILLDFIRSSERGITRC